MSSADATAAVIRPDACRQADEPPSEEASHGDEVLDSVILIVDDAPLMRDVIALHLKVAGFTRLEFATDGVTAIEQVREVAPDLVILDLNMPNMDGFEVCRRLRDDPATRALPILVQSAMDAPTERVKVFEVGATDMISKPINPPELVARVVIHLQNRVLIRSLSSYHARVESELQAAAAMQETLLPAAGLVTEIAAEQGLEITSHYEASSELGGDIWGLRRLDENRLAVFTTDFSGHGVVAALNTFRLHTMMQRRTAMLADPGALLSKLNDFLAGVLPLGQFATMFCGVIDCATDSLTYASAAAPRPLIGGVPAATPVAACDSAGLPLGIKRGVGYPTRRVPFPPGSFLLLYSDALIETPNPGDPVLDEEGLRDLVEGAVREGPASGLLDTVLAHFFERVRRPLPDDLTAVCLLRPQDRPA